MRTKLKQLFFRFLFIFLSIGYFTNANAQFDDFITVVGRLSIDDGKNENVQILITRNGEEEQKFTPPRSGRFKFDFEYNNEYLMTFFKEGYYKKMIVVSTHVPLDILEENSVFPPFQIDVSLVKEIPGIDKSFTNKPAGRVYYNANIDNFDSEVFFSDIQLEEQAAAARSQEQALTAEQRAALVQREQDYKKSIADADALMQSQKYEEALVKFEYARGLFPERPYPNDRIAELQDLISALKLADERRRANDQAYQEKIAEADTFMSRKEYEKAKQSYGGALIIRPDDSYATGQIAMADEMIKEQQIDLRYNNLIAEAQSAYANGNLEQAKSIYQQALLLKPEQAVLIDEQVQKIDNELAEQVELANREEQYQAAMKEGEGEFKKENYQKALVAFRQALTNKPNDVLAEQRISDVENIVLEDQKQKEYSQFVAQADEAYTAGNLAEAKSLYLKALNILPDEDHPKSRISEIDQQIAIREQFEQLVSQANQAAEQSNFQVAKGLYEQALSIKPEEAYLKEKIAEINALIAQREELAQLAAEEERQAKAILEAKQKRYDEAIANAQTAFYQKEYASAKNYLVDALNILPDEQYPKNRIAQIDLLIEQEALVRAERERQAMQDSIRKAHELAFQQKIQEGEEAEADNAFEAAIARYIEAKEILPERSTEVDQRIVQVREKMRKLKELEVNYAVAIKKADRLFGIESWQQANTKYQEALNLKPDEQYPKDQLGIISKRLSELQLAQQAEVEKNKAYRDAIAEAEQAFANEQLDGAKAGFVLAKSIKPNETYPEGRIAEIDRLLARRASQEELVRQQQEIDRRYLDAIGIADREFGSENYEQAKIYYNNALSIKPNESYPQDQLDLIRRLEREQAVAQVKKQDPGNEMTSSSISQAGDVKASGQTLYDQYITSGDQSYHDQNYKVAQYYYQKALNERPNDSYSKEKIGEIGKLINLTMSENALADYENAIKKADKAFSDKHYSVARFYYYMAVEIKSWEQYPREQLQKIQRLTNSLLSEMKEEEYQDYIAKADDAFAKENYAVSRAYYNRSLMIKPDEQYPEIRLKEIADLVEKQLNNAEENEYKNFISEADKAMKLNDYSIARFYYQKALGVKPNENYPRKQLKAIREGVSKASMQLN